MDIAPYDQGFELFLEWGTIMNSHVPKHLTSNLFCDKNTQLLGFNWLILSTRIGHMVICQGILSHDNTALDTSKVSLSVLPLHFKCLLEYGLHKVLQLVCGCC